MAKGGAAMYWVLATASCLLFFVLVLQDRKLLGRTRLWSGLGAWGTAIATLWVRAGIVQDSPSQTCVLLTSANLLLIAITLGHPGRLLALQMPHTSLWTEELERRTRHQAVAALVIGCIAAFLWGWFE